MKENIDINKEIEDSKEQIINQLAKGNDIIIKNTGKGIKIQTLKVQNL